jgi:hypothetical protein
MCPCSMLHSAHKIPVFIYLCFLTLPRAVVLSSHLQRVGDCCWCWRSAQADARCRMCCAILTRRFCTCADVVRIPLMMLCCAGLSLLGW